MTLPELFISSRIVSRIVDAAVARGVDGDALCLAAAIDPDDVRDVDGRIEMGRYRNLWKLAAEKLGDPTLPLRIAETGSSAHNLLRFVCMSCDDLGTALRRASGYLELMTNGASWPIEARDDGIIIRFLHPDSDPSPPSWYGEAFEVAELVMLSRHFTGTECNPREVRFGWPEPDDRAPYLEYFRCPVVFGASATELHVDGSTLRLPLVKADPAMAAFFASYGDKLLRSQSRTETLTERVKRAIIENLRDEAPTLDKIALLLKTSGRTLRRRLHAEGQTFQGILDETRHALAKSHTEAGKLTLPEISFLLGFSEPSAFHRAFRRWTGTTPQAHARTMRHLPKPTDSTTLVTFPKPQGGSSASAS